MVRRTFLMSLAALAWMTALTRAEQILVSSATAVSPSLRDYSEVEVALTYSIATTQITAMRFWFPAGLTGTTTAVMRDGDGNNTGTVVGVPVRNDGSFTVYEFAFSGQLAPRSQYYAGYAFTNSGTAVNIGTTASSVVTFDADMLGNAEYGYLVPDPTDPESATFGQFPRFEIIGVPEPATVSLLAATAVAGGFALLRRRR